MQSLLSSLGNGYVLFRAHRSIQTSNLKQSCSCVNTRVISLIVYIVYIRMMDLQQQQHGTYHLFLISVLFAWKRCLSMKATYRNHSSRAVWNCAHVGEPTQTTNHKRRRSKVNLFPCRMANGVPAYNKSCKEARHVVENMSYRYQELGTYSPCGTWTKMGSVIYLFN